MYFGVQRHILISRNATYFCCGVGAVSKSTNIL